MNAVFRTFRGFIINFPKDSEFIPENTKEEKSKNSKLQTPDSLKCCYSHRKKNGDIETIPVLFCLCF